METQIRTARVERTRDGCHLRIDDRPASVFFATDVTN